MRHDISTCCSLVWTLDAVVVPTMNESSAYFASQGHLSDTQSSASGNVQRRRTGSIASSAQSISQPSPRRLKTPLLHTRKSSNSVHTTGYASHSSIYLAVMSSIEAVPFIGLNRESSPQYPVGTMFCRMQSRDIGLVRLHSPPRAHAQFRP